MLAGGLVVGQDEVAPGLAPDDDRAGIEFQSDAGRADQLVLLHRRELAGATRARLSAALAVPAEADVDDAVLGAVADSPDVALVLLVRDGWVRAVPGADVDLRRVDGGGPDLDRPLADGPLALRLTSPDVRSG